jgi:hypothetical protein
MSYHPIRASCALLIELGQVPTEAARRRGVVLHVIDLLIVRYLLEELIDSWSLCPTMLILQASLF